MSLVAQPVHPPGPALGLTVSTAGSCTTVVAVGEVDTLTAPQLREVLEAAVGEGSREVVVDLRGVTFLDSAGLCALALAARLASDAGVTMRVLCSTQAVVRVLQLTGLWDVLGAEHVPG